MQFCDTGTDTHQKLAQALRLSRIVQWATSGDGPTTHSARVSVGKCRSCLLVYTLAIWQSRSVREVKHDSSMPARGYVQLEPF